MLKLALRQTCAMKGVAIYKWCGYLRKRCGYLQMVWLFTIGVAIYENGVAILNSISRAPCRSQKRTEGQHNNYSQQHSFCP